MKYSSMNKIRSKKLNEVDVIDSSVEKVTVHPKLVEITINIRYCCEGNREEDKNV